MWVFLVHFPCRFSSGTSHIPTPWGWLETDRVKWMVYFRVLTGAFPALAQSHQGHVPAPPWPCRWCVFAAARSPWSPLLFTVQHFGKFLVCKTFFVNNADCIVDIEEKVWQDNICLAKEEEIEEAVIRSRAVWAFQIDLWCWRILLPSCQFRCAGCFKHTV